MKYKVGDKVKVREDLEYNVFYGGTRVNEDMIMHKGKILTIRAIDCKQYLMEEDNWCWTDEMLEDVEEKKTVGEILDNLMENPALVIKELSKALEDCKKVNEDLETKLKNKQSVIDFLKGQISVYEKFLNNEEV